MSYDEHLITQAGGDGDDVAAPGTVQFCHPSVKTEQEAQSATCSNIAAKSWDAIIAGAAPWAEQDEETMRIHTETVRAVLGAVQFCCAASKTEQEAPQTNILESTP